MSATPNDGSYKNLFSHPEMVESLIRDFVPEDWVNDLDFSTLEKQNGSYVADDLRQRHDDIIWRVKCMGQWFYVYLLIEFQSAVDPWMAVRIMTYVGLLYQDLIKAEVVKNGEPLPPVFPLVLYNGADAWNARQEISENRLIQPLNADAFWPAGRAGQNIYMAGLQALFFDQLARQRAGADAECGSALLQNLGHGMA